MTRTTTVDVLLDERNRLTAQKAAIEGHLWAAEFLLHRINKLLPHLIADSPHNAVARDTLADEIRELLAEPRHHPTISVLPDAAAGTNVLHQGNIGQDGTTLADEVAAGLHEEPHP